MSEPRLLDTTGRRRSPAATPGHRAGCSPANKGVRYPADPPRIEEIIAVMRQAGSGAHADGVRALIAILWRAGLRISEALALTESDLDPQSGCVLIRAGKGGKRRMVGMDDWAWEHVNTWTTRRIQLPIGPLFCILDGPTRGRAWSATGARAELRQLAAHAGVRRRFAPHQLRHAHAVEMAHEGIPLPVIQRQLGTRPPRDHLDLPPRHRHKRDHQHRPRPTPTSHPSERRPEPLANDRRRAQPAAQAGPARPKPRRFELVPRRPARVSPGTTSDAVVVTASVAALRSLRSRAESRPRCRSCRVGWAHC
jgi:Phage integrase family